MSFGFHIRMAFVPFVGGGSMAKLSAEERLACRRMGAIVAVIWALTLSVLAYTHTLDHHAVPFTFVTVLLANLFVVGPLVVASMIVGWLWPDLIKRAEQNYRDRMAETAERRSTHLQA